MIKPLLRAALCHEWTTVPGGSEQVASRIAETLGIRDVFTYAAVPKMAESIFPTSRVHVSKLGLTRLGRSHWQWLLAFMPSAWSHLDLSSFDLVITSSHSCTNAINVRPDAYHLSYCHTPMRYAWEWRSEVGRFPPLVREVWPLAAMALRMADRRWAQRVTLFIANSRNVAGRIRRYYQRPSVVIPPPIDTAYWTPDSTVDRGDYFLFAGRLVPYKRADVAVDAANLAGIRLIVAGCGPELDRLKRRAGKTVEFLTDPSNHELRELYRGAQAFVYPGVEDFGMTMVEAQACGTPVVAFNAGGAREIVQPRLTGVLYDEPSPQGLAAVLKPFDASSFSQEAMLRRSASFDRSRFDDDIRHVMGAVTRETLTVAASAAFAEKLQEELRMIE